MKSLPREQPESVTLRIERLHARHIGRHQDYGGVEDAVIQGVEVAPVNQHDADLMQRIVQPVIAGFDIGSGSRKLIRAVSGSDPVLARRRSSNFRLRSKFAVVKSSRLSVNP